MYRFDNGQVRKDGHDCWDIEKLVESVKAGIDAAAEKVTIDSIGIDTWGVDFVLLDEKGEMVSDAVAYRDTRTAGADAEIERDVLSFKKLYAIAGIQKTSFNTIYQLWALKKEHPEQLEKAAHFLMVPEYLNYRLTGNIVHEYTDSSTTSLLDAAKKDWDYELIEKLGEIPALCPHFHLSLQSGSDEILRKMNRKYTKEQYLEKIQKVKERILETLSVRKLPKIFLCHIGSSLMSTGFERTINSFINLGLN